MPRRPATPSGQASIELVAFLPLVLLVALALFSFAAAHAAQDEAGAAAEAGALAVLQGRDPEDAARDAIPRGSRDRARIEVDGGSVQVRVRPRLPIPALADRLAGEAHARASP
jgi:putative Flp pilus-assembly TadE/G-like protein